MPSRGKILSPEKFHTTHLFKGGTFRKQGRLQQHTAVPEKARNPDLNAVQKLQTF